MMPMAPSEIPNWVPLNVRIIHAAVTRPMASHMRLPMYSWKRKAASSVVDTHSKFSKSDAVAAGVLVSPTISRIGAATPPASTAPASHGRSARARGLPLCTSASPRINLKINSPTPLPKYKSAARSTGSTWPNKTLESGALAPKSMAPVTAKKIG